MIPVSFFRNKLLPTQVVGCQLWLKADDGPLNSGIVTPSDGGTVAFWVDRSAAGNHFSQVTDANRPVFKTNIRNGLPVARYTANGGLTSTITWSFSEKTVFIVFKDALQTGVRCIVSNGSQNWYTGTNSNNLFMSWQNTALTQKSISSNQAAGSGEWVVASYRWRISGAIVTTLFHLNGYETVNVATDGYTAGAVGTGWIIGGLNAAGGSNNLNGDIGEVMVYNNAITDLDMRGIENYLGDKWDIPIR